ncbi:MAG: B12-binding domain-containing radical SAM protein, partial [Anaerolineae bacterium]
GCPHKCTYCSVSKIKLMFKDDKIPYLRFRSVPKVIEELLWIKQRYPFVEAIQFFDDTFFARPYKQILDFAEQYKRHVGLPFHVQASPNTLSEKKLVPLLDAGLVYVEFGIQSGSQKIKQMYLRTETNDRIVEAAKLLHKYRDRLMEPDYHVIIDNPWETEEDTMETVKLLYQIPKPYGLAISNLIFFPHTPLYEKAVAEGLITDEQQDVYRKPFYEPRNTYPNFLVNLFSFQHIPRWVYRMLISDTAVKVFSKQYYGALLMLVTKINEAIRFLAKAIGVVLRWDTHRMALYLRRWQLVDPGVTGRKH